MDLRYEAPDTLQAAVALLAKESGPARVLAGGTDVIVQMETDLIEPALLVDIKKIPEVRAITAEGGGFRVGAAATGMEIMAHAGLCKAWPGVLDGVKLIGSIQVRGRADRAAGEAGGRCADRHACRRWRARQARRRRQRRLPADRRQARDQGISDQGGGRAGTAHRATGARTGKAELMSKKYHVTTT